MVALISAQVLASRQKLHEHAKDYTIIAQKHRRVPYVTKGNQPSHSRQLLICYSPSFLPSSLVIIGEKATKGFQFHKQFHFNIV